MAALLRIITSNQMHENILLVYHRIHSCHKVIVSFLKVNKVSDTVSEMSLPDGPHAFVSHYQIYCNIV